jgi:hypothetical protein
MNGSEDTDVLPAAVLSGAPIELEARTVRSVIPLLPPTTILISTQNLPTLQNRHTVRELAQPSLAHGLGHPLEGPPMGEPSYGLAIIRRFHAGHTYQLQEQGGCDCLCGEAGL